MKFSMQVMLFAIGLLGVETALAQNSPVQNIWNSDWVGVDGANRALPLANAVGAAKQRWVGVFYWLWQGSVRTDPIRDVSQELLQNSTNPQWAYQDWWWSQPENGYYHSGDAWVARKNLTMLANAGVDFIYFDYTNGPIGDPYLQGFLNVAEDLKSKGVPVPKFVFFLNTNSVSTMNTIYSEIYQPQKYKDLWFQWEGKPLVLASPDSAYSSDIKNFFTFRHCWAFQSGTTDEWRFIDDYPQRPSTHNGTVEQMVVNKSMGAPLWPKSGVDNKGSSYTKHNADKGIYPVYNQYWLADSTPFGLYFQEEWNRADSVDAPLTMVTGWNEWTAGAWNFDAGTAANYNFMGKPVDQDPNHWYFVDEFNEENNRDMEPMLGGYGDNYYYQLVENVRKYKGMPAATTASAPTTITIDGNFADWNGVLPLYLDPAGDTQNRNYQNCNNSATLTNTTGRNDIIQAQVAHDATNMYFHVKTTAALTPSTDPQWMELYINADQNYGTGWNGYDYKVRGAITNGMREVDHWSGSAWVSVGQVVASAQGADLELSVAKSVLAVGDQPNIDFKWADNAGTTSGMEIFVDHGDAAPDRRFNYRYTASASANVPRTPYLGSPLQLPDTIQIENFDNGGEGISYHDADPINYGGQYRNTGVDIQATTGGYSVGWANTGEWLEYTVSVATAGNYTLALRVASVNGNDTVKFLWDGTDIGNPIAFSATGGLQAYTLKSTAAALSSGTHVLRLYIQHSDGGFNMDWILATSVAGVSSSSSAPSSSSTTVSSSSTGTTVVSINLGNSDLYSLQRNLDGFTLQGTLGAEHLDIVDVYGHLLAHFQASPSETRWQAQDPRIHGVYFIKMTTGTQTRNWMLTML